MWGSLDWLFPPVCGGCDQTGYRWCPDCRQQVKPVPQPACRICSLPLSKPGLCPTCKETPPQYNLLRSWAVFEGPIRHALHSLKYRRNLGLGDALARCLADFVSGLDWHVDLVAPVPLGRQRMQERGYNQVVLFAKPMAGILHWRFSSHLLERVRETRSQVGLTPLERKENISGAFRADRALASGKAILLVDDVTTTGATIAACSEALVAAGAKTVSALTLARALPHHGLKIV
jgi:ComF family protein